MKKITLTIIPALLIICSPAIAQDIRFGVFAGLSNYTGDLQKARYTFNQAHPAFGILLEKDIDYHFSIRGALTFARISGDDLKAKDSSVIVRNLNFRSNITEFQLVGEYNLWDLTEKRFTPYIFAGLALYHFNPTALDTNGSRVELQPLSTEGEGLQAYPGRPAYHLTQVAIPFGGGIKLALTPDIILGFEVGLRKTFTDYLDDLSTTYPDANTLLKEKGPLAVRMSFRTNRLPGHENDPFPKEGTLRGSSKYKDWYYFTGLTLTFRIKSGGGRGRGGHTPKDMLCPPTGQ